MIGGTVRIEGLSCCIFHFVFSKGNLAAFRGKYPVLAICYKEKTMRHLALSYGVEAIFMPEKANGQAYYFAALRKLLDDGVLQPTDMVAYLSGGKQGTQGFCRCSRSWHGLCSAKQKALSVKDNRKTKKNLVFSLTTSHKDKVLFVFHQLCFLSFQADIENSRSLDLAINKSLNLWCGFVVFLHKFLIPRPTPYSLHCFFTNKKHEFIVQ